MRTIQILFCVLLLSFFGCREEFERITISETPNNLPSISVSTSIRGVVRTSGRLLDGVTVSSPSLGSTVTDENGVFNLSSDNANGNGVQLTFSKNGWVTQRRMIVPGANTTYYEVVELPTFTSGQINATSGGSFSLDNGAEIVVAPNSAFVGASPYSGNIIARMVHYAPEDFQEMLQSPGNFPAFSGNELLVLESFGMIDIELETPDGQSVYFDDENPAELFFPLDEATASIAAETIDFWQLVENVWNLIDLDGPPTDLSGNRYRARITTGGTYNCDIPSQAVRLCGRLLDAEGVPLPHEIFAIRSVGGMTLNIARTDCMGHFCAWASRDTPLELVVLDPCTDEEFVFDLGTFSGSSASVGDITINLNFTAIPTQVTICATADPVPLDQVGVWINGLGFAGDYQAVNSAGQTTVAYADCGDGADKQIQAVSFDGFSSSQIDRRDVNDNSPLELFLCPELDADEQFDLNINGQAVSIDLLNHVLQARSDGQTYLVNARGVYNGQPFLLNFLFKGAVTGTFTVEAFHGSSIYLFSASNPATLESSFFDDPQSPTFELNITDVGPNSSYVEGNYTFSAHQFETASQMTIATDIPVSVNFRLNL